MTPSLSFDKQVFMSYSRKDEEIMQRIAMFLRNQGMAIWVDNEELEPGTPVWEVEIEQAIMNASAVIVLASPDSKDSEWVRREITFAERYRKRIFPVLVRGDEDSSISIRLSTKQFVDIRQNEEVGLRSLGAALLNYLNTHDVQVVKKPVRIAAEQRTKKKRIHKPAEKQGGQGKSKKMGQEKESMGKGKEKINPVDVTQKEQDVQRQKDKVQDVLKIGTFEFVRIPAGKFLMGSLNREQQASAAMQTGNFNFPNTHPEYECPQHTVEIPYDFWIARFPVTNEQYAPFPSKDRFPHPVENWRSKRDHPVSGVEWEKAMSYCDWLNQVFHSEIHSKIPSGLLIRLPTEAEWEKAARGDDGREWPWGNKFFIKNCNSSERMSKQAASKKDTTPVAFHAPQGDSPFGCSDMVGNVGEWTLSLYASYPYDAEDGRNNPKALGPRVVRGGSYEGKKQTLRVACRFARLRDYIRLYRRSQVHGIGLLDPNRPAIINNTLVGFRIVIAPPIT